MKNGKVLGKAKENRFYEKIIENILAYKRCFYV